jgi:murein DD-endopeptidase MepM/ murein hydrolase activator NlpD
MKKTKLNAPNKLTRQYFRLGLISILMLATSMVCRTGYITPASLTETAEFTPEETIVPTVQFIRPTETQTPPPTATATLDPRLATATPVFNTPTPSVTPLPTSTQIAADTKPMEYYAQSGETLAALASRFNVHPFEIVSDKEIPQAGYIPPGQMLLVPNRLLLTTPNIHLLPDSEVVYSPSALDFITEIYVDTFNSHLSDYSEYMTYHGIQSGGEVVEITALNHSINPRLLLSLLEYNGHWVLGHPGSFSEESYPMGHADVNSTVLSAQLNWAAKEISVGYYSWRDGTLTDIEFKDGSTLRLAPDLNAGTVGLMYYFAQIMPKSEWFNAIDPDNGFLRQHIEMFGDPKDRAAIVEPLLPAGLEQPEMVLPFQVGDTWAYTGGPHGAWTIEGPQAAIDFAPSSVAHGCAPSELWAVATATGMVIRNESGVLILDLDGDGNEQTGWAMFYLHLVPHPRLQVGDWVNQGNLIGKPSCEGGRATGTHVHMARKYNGEWILASGPVPMVLSGWTVVSGEEVYQGGLTNGDKTVIASDKGAFTSRVTRDAENTDG